MCFTPLFQSIRKLLQLVRYRNISYPHASRLLPSCISSHACPPKAYNDSGTPTTARRKVDCPIRIASVVVDNFKDTRPFAFPRLCAWMFATKLRHAKCSSNFVLNYLGKG